MKALVLVNRGAGKGTVSPEDLAARLRQRGLEVEACWLDAASVPQKMESAPGSLDVVVAAGGDGTVSSVAGRLAGTGLALGVLPLGTLNHFAKDLGIPQELEAALDCVAGGHVIRVDVGEVNGQRFINNSSIGAYPLMVKERDQKRQRFGSGKWPAMVAAFWNVLARCPLQRVRLTLDGQVLNRKTPFVFIGNNRYTMELFALGARATLQEGVLSVYMAHCSNRLQIARLAGHVLLNRLNQAADFDALTATKLKLELPRAEKVRVALDGELRAVRPPLFYRIRPGILRVLVPGKP